MCLGHISSSILETWFESRKAGKMCWFEEIQVTVNEGVQCPTIFPLFFPQYSSCFWRCFNVSMKYTVVCDRKWLPILLQCFFFLSILVNKLCQWVSTISFLTDDEKFELTVINPGFIMGPVLHGSNCTSMEVQIRPFHHCCWVYVIWVPSLNVVITGFPQSQHGNTMLVGESVAICFHSGTYNHLHCLCTWSCMMFCCRYQSQIQCFLAPCFTLIPTKEHSDFLNFPSTKLRSHL